MRRLLVVLRRRVLLVALAVVAGLAAAYLGSSRTGLYESRATLYVGQSATNLNPSTEVAEAVLAQTFALIIPTPQVVSAAIAAAQVPRQAAAVEARTTAVVPPGTNLIKIAVRDTDPGVAQKLTNSIADTFVTFSLKLAPVTADATGGSAGKAPAAVAQRASVPGAPIATGFHRNILLGGLAGLGVGIVVVLLLDFLGMSARTPRQLEAEMGMAVLAVIPLQPLIARAGEYGEPPDADLLLMGDDA